MSFDATCCCPNSFDFDEEDEAAVIEYLRKWSERRQMRLNAKNKGIS